MSSGGARLQEEPASARAVAREAPMRSKVLVGQSLLLAAVAGFLSVTNPVAAEAAIARCEVTAVEPRGIAGDPEAYVEGWSACDRAILPERFDHAVCLQAKKGRRFVDIHCCRVFNTRVNAKPWLMCGEGGPLLEGTHQYRTRARAVRLSNGHGETDYSAAVSLTF
jgi:hypothetical protein